MVGSLGTLALLLKRKVSRIARIYEIPILAALFLAPCVAHGQPDPPRQEIDFHGLLTEIEAGLRTQPSEEFRAYGLARLGRLHYGLEAPRAKELWKEAFHLSLGLKKKSPFRPLSQDRNSLEVLAFQQALGESPSRVQATIFQSLAEKDEWPLAAELVELLPKHEAPQPPKGVAILPLMGREEEDLARAAVRVASGYWKISPDKSFSLFATVLSRFENFPYGLAPSFLSAAAERPEVARQAANLVISQFESRKLDPEVVPVSVAALRGMAGLLPSLDKTDARRAAEAVRRKLSGLQSESERWKGLARLIEPGFCPYLAEDASECKLPDDPGENLASKLPPEARKALETAQTRERAPQIALENPEQAVQIANEIADIFERAQVLVEIAKVVAKKDIPKAKELLEKALELTESEAALPPSRKLQAFTQIAAVSVTLAPETFRRAVKGGVSLIGEDALEAKEELERLLFIRVAVRLLGFWVQAEPDLALNKIRGLPDAAVRVRALLDAADGLVKQRGRGPLVARMARLSNDSYSPATQ